MIKRIRVTIITALIMALLPLSMISTHAEDITTIGVDEMIVEAGATVSVPIRIRNNSGVCGATITIAYGVGLELTGVEKGDALGSLTMTKPGNFTANPINIVWDGLEEDNSDGIMAELTFKVPEEPGDYDIKISYEDGDIVNGDLEPVDVEVMSGKITVENWTMPVQPMISVGNAETKPNEEIIIPINITDNTGICGATITIAYGKGLELTGVDKGEALGSLTMTKPGNFTANPINIVWDGLEEDTSNGVMAFLTFRTPEEAGIYDIRISYADGDIVDGNLVPVDVKTGNGQIKVISDGAEKIPAENIGVFYDDAGYENGNNSATAFRAEMNDLTGNISFNIITSTREERTFENITTVADANIVLGIIVSGLADAGAVGQVIIK